MPIDYFTSGVLSSILIEDVYPWDLYAIVDLLILAKQILHQSYKSSHGNT